MMRRSLAVLICGILCASLSPPLHAQELENAQWVWFDAGNPLESAPAGKVWFRTVVRGNEPSTGAIRILCDDQFTLWVNGQKIGGGGAERVQRFNLNGIVERGLNVIAVEAENKDGRAGLFVDGEIRGQSGKTIPFDTPHDWTATTTAPEGNDWLSAKYDATSWKPVKTLVAHKDSPWKSLQIAGTYLDRFEVPAGFELKRIGEPTLVGSLVCITWGQGGTLLASRERGPILVVKDHDADGTYDAVTEYSSDIKNCQGLCQVRETLYAVGEGPQGAGVYVLPDADQDGKADSITLLTKYKGGIAEHGAHDIVWGPDGWLYHNLGNHSWIENTPEPTSPSRQISEGYLLEPKFEDAGGHAVGIKAPGGTIWRFSPDGQQWWLETNGFRNEYDIAFNSQGDLFTFDSDMEWDVNLPWYRPVRINHCIPGAEFGWRSGSGKWPEYNFDSLPGTVNVGRGSPTGVLFYEHTQFPEKYRGAMLNCDWSMGRLIVSFLKPDGATYSGTWENLITGNPLNISDVEVDRDGTVVFATGGRNTEGGLYRLTYTGAPAVPTPVPETAADVVNLPQGQSHWARELIAAAKVTLGDQWEPGLLELVKSGTPAQKIRALSILKQLGPSPEHAVLIAASEDADAGVRAFATWLLGNHTHQEVADALAKRLDDRDATVRRRACEAFVRSGQDAPVAPLLKLLASSDRWERWAARIALERVPVEAWKAEILKSKDPFVVQYGLLALIRLPGSVTNAELKLALRNVPGPGSTTPAQVNTIGTNMIRLMQLVLLAQGDADLDSEQLATNLGRQFLEFSRGNFPPQFQTAQITIDSPFILETARLVAKLDPPQAAEALVNGLTTSRNLQTQMHLALCARYVKQGWTPDVKQRLLTWYEGTKDVEGGNSLQGYLRNIVGATLEVFTPEERAAAVQTWATQPHAARLVLSVSLPDQIAGFDTLLGELLQAQDQNPAVGDLVQAALESLTKSQTPSAQATLRKLFDDYPDRRNVIARGLAAQPTAENAPYYLRALLLADLTTLQQTLQALRQTEFKPEQSEPYRAAIVAGLKLGNQGGGQAVQLLQKWTDSQAPQGKDPLTALAHYQAWYAEKFPAAPAAVLVQDDLEKSKYSLQQLVDFLETPVAQQGDVTRGKAVFAKANCLKCHRFVNEGEGVGPDLTTVRRRFQKREILESVLFPSQVISDQYRSQTVVTTDGLIYNGLIVPQPGVTNAVTILLSDATKVTVPKDKIDEQTPSKTSVMPEGLFKELSLQDIANLFAFLETSKLNPEPAKN